MAMDIGASETVEGLSGMSKQIYDAIVVEIEKIPGVDLDAVPSSGSLSGDDTLAPKENIRRLSIGIATGVINHIRSNADLLQQTDPAGTGPHTHGVTAITID